MMPTYTTLVKRVVVWRRFIAWIAHAPGLWFFYGETLSKPMQRANFVAAVITLVAVGGVLTLVHHTNRLAAALIVWGSCHVTWGSYLAWHLSPISSDYNVDSDEQRPIV